MTTVLYLHCLTFDLKVKCHGTKQKPIMISYMSTIQLKSLSLVVFEKAADFTWDYELKPPEFKPLTRF